MEEFLRLGMQAELIFPHVRIAHGTLIEEKDLAVCGLGGLLAERPLMGIDHYLRPTAEYFLRSLRWTQKPRTVLLLPAPPPGRLGGSDGDPLIGELVDSFHPDLCVVRGSSARRGTQRIGRTLVVNPGSLSDGWTAWLDWQRPAEDRVRFVNATDLGYEGGECQECAGPHTRQSECESVRWS
jgi:Icc-related predicted phosphoesterase